MPESDNLVTTCPLCLGADEIASMLTVEIDRAVPRGRAAIMLCRSCAGAVVLSIGRLGEAEATALLEMHCQPEIGPVLERLRAASRGSDDDSSTN
jgi:hypothetical protein